MASKKIKGLTVEIGGDTTKLGKALQDVEKQTRSLQSELKGINSLLKLDPTNTTLLTQKQKVLAESVEETKKKLETLKSVQEQVERQFENGEIGEDQFRDFQREIESTEIKLKSLTKELRNFGSVGAQQIAAVGEKMKKTGEKISDVGEKLIPVSTAAAGALAAVSKTAIDFESAWTGVLKTVEGTPDELEAVRQGILDLSQETASSAVDIAAVAEAAGQLGIELGKDGETLLSFTKTMVMLGDSTNLTADEAATALAKFANITQMSSDKYENLGSAIVDLGNNFATTEADIVEMATRLASTGEVTGLTEAQILALATTLSSVGIEAQAGGTAISKLLKKLYTCNAGFDSAQVAIDKTGLSLRELQLMQSNNSKDFKALADSLGMTSQELKGYMDNVAQMNQYASAAGVSVEEFRKAYGEDAVGALSLFIAGLNDTERNGKNAVEILNEMGLTEVRLSNAILAMAASGDLMNEAVRTSNEAFGEGNALSDEASKRYETTAAKIQQLKGALTEMSVTLGEIVLPIIQDVVAKLQEWVNKFSELSPTTQKVILGITAFTAILAPALIGIGKVVSALGTLMTYAPQITSAFNLMKTGVLNAINSLASLGSKALTALGSAGTKALTGLQTAGSAALSGLKTAGSAALNAMKSLASTVFPAIKTAGATAFTALKTVATTALTGLRTVLSTVVTFAKTALTGLFKLILAHPVAAVVAAVVALLIVLYNKCEWFRDGVNNVVKKIGEFVKKIPGFFAELPGKIVSVGKNIMTGLLSGIQSGWQSLKNGISGICDSVVGWFQDKLQINSPSKVIAKKIGRAIPEGLGLGVEQGEDEALDPVDRMVDNLVHRAQYPDGLSLERNLQQRAVKSAMSVTTMADSSMLGKLDKILTAIEKGQIITLDGKALVGGTVNAYDTALGQRRMLAARGAV